VQCSAVQCRDWSVLHIACCVFGWCDDDDGRAVELDLTLSVTLSISLSISLTLTLSFPLTVPLSVSLSLFSILVQCTCDNLKGDTHINGTSSNGSSSGCKDRNKRSSLSDVL